MPSPLDAIERFMEEAVEGTVQRVFRAKLQPVQLAKVAARRMDAQQVVGPYGPEVPNSFTIALHPTDFQGFAQYQVALEGELARYLSKFARDRGWRPVSAITVALRSDASAPRGRPRVVAQMSDTSADEPALVESTEPPIERTVVRRQARPLPEELTAVEAAARAQLVGENGDRFVIDRPLVRLGRALENDIVIPDSRVSRFHAEIRRSDGSFVLQDLGSTNGTQVAKQPVDRRSLKGGETISLGGYELRFSQF